MEALRAEGWRLELNFADDPVPPIAASDAVAPTLDVLEQVKYSFPDSDPVDQADAAENVRSLQFINKT